MPLSSSLRPFASPQFSLDFPTSSERTSLCSSCTDSRPGRTRRHHSVEVAASSGACRAESGPRSAPRQARRPSRLQHLVRQHIATKEETDRLIAYVRAWTAMYGSVIFWVGAWSFLDVHVNDSVDFRWDQHLRDCGLGLATMLLTDCYYQLGFAGGSILPPVPPRLLRRLPPQLLAMLQQLRVLMALLGSVAFWNGLYNMLYRMPRDEHIVSFLGLEPGPDSLIAARGLKTANSVALGLSLLLASGSLLAVSCLPVGAPRASPVWGGPLRDHLKTFSLATGCLLGQVALWFGVYEFSLTYCPGATLDEFKRCTPLPADNAWKPLALLSMGLVCHFATDTFIPSAFLDRPPTPREQPRETLLLYLRALLALLGSAVHNTGLWVLIDETFFAGVWRNCSWRSETADSDSSNCASRSVIFIPLGYVLMLLSESAAGNVGLPSAFRMTSLMTPTPMLRRDQKGVRSPQLLAAAPPSVPMLQTPPPRSLASRGVFSPSGLQTEEAPKAAEEAEEELQEAEMNDNDSTFDETARLTPNSTPHNQQLPQLPESIVVRR